jgi:CheY-like chemotaxis protein
MKCPRCSAGIAAAPDPGGVVTCAGCGARLRSARATVPQPVAAGVAAKAPPRRVSSMPHATDIDSMLSRLDADESSLDDLNPNLTLPPGTPLPPVPRPLERKRNPGEDTAKVMRPSPAAVPTAPAAPVSSSGVTLDMLLEEIRTVQATQDRILELLRARPSSSPGLPSMSEDSGALSFPDIEAPEAPAAPGTTPATPVRSRRRKTVILIDDDKATREAAVAALQTAEVPVRAVATGNDGLAAIAEAKPDVIVMELAVGGDMGGKDVVNMIKATMEWVDIPILLYTRVPIESQKEARTIHGADEFVLKSAGAEALVARVITVFRKG